MAKEMSKTEKMRKLFASKTLDAEEMDAIAGGTYGEIADDSRFLNVLLRGHPLQPERVGKTRLQLGNTVYENNFFDKKKAEVQAAWNAVGVKCALNPNHGNSYIVNGKLCTQEAAMEHAMKVMGKQLKDSDWYWGD